MLLISDFDGTMVDSEGLIIASYEHVIETYNLTRRSKTELRACTGSALRDLYPQWASAEMCPALCETHREFQSRHTHLLTVIPGIIETFQTLRQRGVKIAVNTNRSESVHNLLKNTGLGLVVDHVLTCNDVKNPKPHPEGILKIMNLLGLGPDNVWMFGDMPADILAGKSASVRTIGAVFTEGKNTVHEHSPDHIVTSPHELIGILFP